MIIQNSSSTGQPSIFAPDPIIIDTKNNLKKLSGFFKTMKAKTKPTKKYIK